MSASERHPIADDAEVLYDVVDRMATVTLNRPHRRMAISARMLHQLSLALGRADLDRAFAACS